MSRATDELMDALHALQAETLLSELRRAREAGEGVSPALFTAINKFLKDNGVDRAVVPGDPTDLLADELPDFGDDNVYSIKS